MLVLDRTSFCYKFGDNFGRQSFLELAKQVLGAGKCHGLGADFTEHLVPFLNRDSFLAWWDDS